MWLNGWNRRFVLVGLLLLKLTSTWAQLYLKPLSELDRLSTWYPVNPSSIVYTRSISSANPYTYSDLNELLQKVKTGSKIESLRIDNNLLKDGHLGRLSALTGIRVLHVNLNRAVPQQIDSLFVIIQDWPALERLVVNVNSVGLNEIDPSKLVVLPMDGYRFAKLHDVQLSGSGIQWNASLRALAALKTLRQLTLTGRYSANEQTLQFTALPQLTELRIVGSGFVIKPGIFAELGQLQSLVLSEVKVDSTTFERTVNELANLENLAIESTRSLKRLTLSSLKNLKTLELTNNDNLVVESTTFGGLAALERLVIYGALVKDLSAFCSLSNLRTLIVSGQGKSIRVTNCLGELHQLTELRLDRQVMEQLPNGISTLRQLKKLSLAQCGLDSLPPTINQMIVLEELNLAGNKLSALPNISQLRTLKELNVSGNQLTTLPDNLGQLTQLTTLNLSNNKLTQLPTTVSRLTALRTLFIVNNQIERLPDDFGKLRKLRTLSLQNNSLVSLPATIDQLDSLQGLFVSNNKLKSLPITLAKLKNLTQLHIGKNELTTLPTNFGELTSLSLLLIESNPLVELPTSIGQLRNLKSLTIRGTQLRLLPETIGGLTNLEWVMLTNNELIALPNSIGGWQNVNSLSLEQNRLEGLPNGIGRLSKLMFLRITGKDKVTERSVGGLQQLPDSIIYCSQLGDLVLERQPQLDANDVFTKLARMKSLTHIRITESNISQLPDINWETVNWQILTLSQNLLTELPVGMLQAPSLRTIAVSQNRLPEVLNRDFQDKEMLQVAFVEAGALPMERLSKPSRKVAAAYQQLSRQKAQQRDWAGALADLDKAVEYAPDTTRAFAYGQRASFHFFRKEYPEALTDYDKAIKYSTWLRKDKSMDSVSAKRIVTAYWQQKAAVLGITGQSDAALMALTQAESLLPNADNTTLSGLVYTERGRYLTLKDKLVEADTSYRKAIRSYEKLLYAEPGTRLTIVELSLLTGQYDRAQRAIANIPTEQLRNGYEVLKEYLETCLAVLKGEESTKAMERLTAFLGKHPTKIYGWSFDLFDNWLGKSKLPSDKVTALRQLTDTTKERLVKPQ